MLRKIFASCALGFAPAIIFGAFCIAVSAPMHVTVGGVIYGAALGATRVAQDFAREHKQNNSMLFKMPR